jgi:WD40 repeat protein
MRALNLQRLWLLLPVVLVIVVACRAEPTATPTPLAPLPTPVPRTPVLLSPRAITAENAKQVQLLACTEDAWLLLAFSPDSSLLAVTCQGGICLHNARTLACIRRFGHDDAYLSAAFSPDGHLLATGTEGGTVWLWRVADGSVERVLEARNQRFWAVAFSADGTTLVASDLTPEVFVWRVADGSLLHSFKGRVPRNYRPPQPIAVALSPDGALLALKERGEVRVWRTDNGSLLRVLQGPGPATGCVVFSGDGRLLAAHSPLSADDISIWEFQGAALFLLRRIARGGSSTPLALSPDGTLLATGSAHLTLLLRSAGDGATLLEKPDRVGGLLFSPDSSLLASSSRGMTCVWGLPE